jgi:hypothetical protein
MSHRLVSFALLVCLLIAPSLATAQDATPVEDGLVLPPDALVDGHTLGEWNARYVQWYIGLLVAGVTTFDDETGARCGYGQHGPVFFLDNAPMPVERACTVPSDVVLFVPIFNYECSTLEPDPELPDPAHADEAALRACAKTHIDVGLERDFPMLGVTVDGASVDLSPYRAPSPLYSLVFPPDNEWGVPAGVAQSVVDGYAVMIGPLPAGEHVVEMTFPGEGGSIQVTYRLTVSTGLAAGSATPVS